jgi:hypothetical protein
MDWLDHLDIQRSIKNCLTDIIGDWYYDPWGWPELTWISQKPGVNHLLRRLDDERTGFNVPLRVVKENFAIRPAIVMDPVDRVAYQCLVDRVSKVLIGDLPSFALGWRLFTKPEAGKYAPNNKQWYFYRRRLRNLSAKFPYALKTDIASYFASISVSDLMERIFRVARKNRVTLRLEAFLQTWDKTYGRSGLPQRFLASSALAQFYLKPIDEFLGEFRVKLLIPDALEAHWVLAARWMDDIWIFGNRAESLRRIQVDLADRLAELGLMINYGKTDVLEGDQLKKEIENFQLDYIDVALAGERKDLVPIEEEIDRTLEQPAHASRSVIRFLTHRIRKHKLWQYVDQFVEEAESMPHAADHLARLFRESEAWRDLQGWFIDLTGPEGTWATLDWSASSLARMFPGLAKGVDSISSLFEKVLQTRSVSLPFFSVALQRLAQWNPRSARELIRDVARSEANPFLRRSLALSALNAEVEASFVRRLLRELPDNQVTLDLLEAQGYAPIRVVADFQGQ